MSKLNILSRLSILTKEIYDLAGSFPKDEKYITESQAKRAVISARINIREGNTFRDNNKIRHFNISKGSLEEVDECIIIAKEFNWVTEKQFEKYRRIYWECLNMLNKLISSVCSDKK